MFVYWQNAIFLLLPAIHALRFEVHENTTLENKDIKELSPMGIRLCVNECVKLEGCKSAKFRKMTMTCTLLSSTHLEAPTIISAGVSYIYIDKENDNPCSGCQEHDICESVKTGISKCIKTEKACNNGWRRLINTCYKASNVTSRIQEARESCRKMGKDVILAEPKSEEENNFLVNLTSNKHHHIWIGASNVDTEGVWLFFSDSSQFTWTNWDFEQGSNKNQSCIAIDRYRKKWHDVNCNPVQFLMVVCQYNIN